MGYEITYGAPGSGTPLVSNLVTASTEACAAAAEPVELTEGSNLYCDRDYVFTTLPPFLQGTVLIPTANNDKRSDPANTEFVCFDLAGEATVYLLYDSRVEDSSEPGWLQSMFVGQHMSVAETTDSGMGDMNVWVYYAEEAGTVCLGGNNAPGIGSNYVVAVGRAVVHSEIVGTVSGYSYIGCFIDSSSRDTLLAWVASLATPPTVSWTVPSAALATPTWVSSGTTSASATTTTVARASATSRRATLTATWVTSRTSLTSLVWATLHALAGPTPCTMFFTCRQTALRALAAK